MSSAEPTPATHVTAPHGATRGRGWLVAAGVISVAGLAAGLLFFGDFTPTATLVREAKRALARKEFQRAEQTARRVLARSPHDAASLRIAAEAATELERFNLVPTLRVGTGV